MVTNLTGFSESIIPFLLVTIGIGMTIGNLAAGRIADRSIRACMYIGFGGLVISLVLLAFTTRWIVAIFFVGFLLGLFSAMFTPSVQSRLLDLARQARRSTAQ
jgi:DHA1 family inner membrane transport protein